MNSFGTRASLDVSGRRYEFHALDALASRSELERLPYSIKILLENLLRMEDDTNVAGSDIEALVQWNPTTARPR